MNRPDVKVLRVMGRQSYAPEVMAIVDGNVVRWKDGEGWTCKCLTEGDECVHVDAVTDLLHDRVLGDEE